MIRGQRAMRVAGALGCGAAAVVVGALAIESFLGVERVGPDAFEPVMMAKHAEVIGFCLESQGETVMRESWREEIEPFVSRACMRRIRGDWGWQLSVSDNRIGDEWRFIVLGKTRRLTAFRDGSYVMERIGRRNRTTPTTSTELFGRWRPDASAAED